MESDGFEIAASLPHHSVHINWYWCWHFPLWYRYETQGPRPVTSRTTRQHLNVSESPSQHMLHTHWVGRLTWGNTGIHKSHHDLCIYFKICGMYVHSAGVSSVPSGGALGSRKSGCCSSFKYLAGVRTWVEPTRDKNLKSQLGTNPESLFIM